MTSQHCPKCGADWTPRYSTSLCVHWDVISREYCQSRGCLERQRDQLQTKLTASDSIIKDQIADWAELDTMLENAGHHCFDDHPTDAHYVGIKHGVEKLIKERDDLKSKLEEANLEIERLLVALKLARSLAPKVKWPDTQEK